MRINMLSSTILLLVSVSPIFAQEPAPTPAPAPAATPAAKSADDLARRAIDMLAGPAWDKARYVSFTFSVMSNGKVATSFPQRWDRFTGDYRVSGRDPQGNDFEVIMNVNTKKGRAWKNGSEVTDPAIFDTGYRRFINDTYWLLMPLKSMDPGVHREYVGERSDQCGHAWDVVKLSFDQGVGLTPGDNYWMWVNRDTGIVDEWDMHLQNMKPDEIPLSVYFHDFKRIGGVLLSTRREIRGKTSSIEFGDVVVSNEVPKGAFEK
jgi:hypothetical protein